MIVSVEEKIKEYFERYHEVAGVTRLRPAVRLDYEQLADHSKELSDRLKTEPHLFLSTAEDTLAEMTGVDSAQLLISNYDGISVGIRELRDTHIGNLVSIDGIVSQTTSVMPKAETAVFECRHGHRTRKKQRLDADLQYPRVCSHEDCDVRRDRDFRLEVRPTEKINFQKLEIQEPHDQVQGGETPESITVNVKGAMAGQVMAGDRVNVIGIYKAVEQSESSVFRTFVSGNYIEAEQQEFEELEISEEDIKRIEDFAGQPDIFETLVDSVAPTIRGLRKEKEACVYQLFRGIRKSEMETPIRGDIHILMVGDPSVGKSQVLRYVSNVAPRAVMTSGKGTSEAGLTVSAVRDTDMGGDEEWKLKAGAMVLADEGIACIDEIDKMDSSDRSALHQGMEQQTISVAKAGITATLKSRCAVLAAANPEQGRWDEFDPIPTQIDLTPPLVSRFDLIFAPKDEQDNDEDRKLAEHILQTNQYGQELEAGVEPTTDGGSVEPTIEPELLTKYIAYARSNLNPVMSDEALDQLQEFFVEIRSEGDEDAIPITARKIEGLVRISEAAARIQLSNEVTVEHAQRAIKLVKESLRDVGYDEEAGRFDIDKIESGQTSTQRDRRKHLHNVIDELEDEDERGVSREDVLDKMEDRGFDRTKVEELIDKETQSGGDLFEPSSGKIAPL